MSGTDGLRDRLGDEGWRALREGLTAALREVGLQPSWGPAELSVTGGGAGPVDVPLDGLVQALAETPREDWGPLLADAARGWAAGQQGETSLGELEAIQDHVKLRLTATHELDGPAESLVSMPVMPEVLAVVVVDLPDRVVSVAPAHLTAWGLSPQQAVSLAMHNVMAEDAPHVETLEGPEDAPIQVWSGPSSFVATRVLVLEREVDSPHGALVALPNRHHLLVHPITDKRAIPCIQALAQLATRGAEAGQRPLSTDVFWWKPGQIARIGLEIDPATGAVAIRPPPAFAEVLSALGAGPATPPASGPDGPEGMDA